MKKNLKKEMTFAKLINSLIIILISVFAVGGIVYAARYIGYDVNVNGFKIDDNLTVTGKLTTTTIDPVYNIGGKNYATYVADMAGGVKMETAGKIEVRAPFDGGYRTELDFSRQPEGSDLWLFYQVSDLGDEMENLVVTLTSQGKGGIAASYDLVPSDGKIIIYSGRPTTVSYRLIAPRIDHEKWTNLAPAGAEGIDVSSYR